MKQRNGFSLVVGFLVLLITVALGFTGYTVWKNSQDNEVETVETSQKATQNSNLESISNASDTNQYSNPEFRFSLEYPAKLSATQVNTSDGYEGSGKTMNFIIDEDIYVVSNTSDYNIGPKGPIPLSGLVANGYVDKGGVFYYSDGKSEITADKIESRDNFIYIENRILFQGEDNPTEYIALINTKMGGLVIYSENPDKINIIEEIARSASTN